jgi:hypothetical protein
VLEQNDLQEEVITLVKRLDSFYFNLVMLELDSSLKQGDMHQAIEAYEKLTGTFSRLDPEQQNQLVNVVHGLAQRLGLEVHV